MTMTTGMRAPAVLPPVPVAVGGVLSVARVVPTDGHELLGVEGESDACTPAYAWDEFCTNSPTAQKVFEDGPAWLTGDPFAVYGSSSCDFISMDEAEARARRRLDYNERRLVDAAVTNLLYTDSTQIAPDPVSLLAALSLLEGAAIKDYGGELTILMPVGYLTYACGKGYLSGQGGDLRTCQGSRVAGYVNETVENQVYVTGAISLFQGPVRSYVAPPMVDGTGTWLPTRALAERIYVPVIDCLALNVDVDLDLCDCTVAPATQTPQTTLAPELLYLSHTSVSVGAAPFGLHVHGENFTDDSFITVNANQMPTAFVDDHELVTVINPAAWTAGGSATVTVTSPNGTSSALTLSFTA